MFEKTRWYSSRLQCEATLARWGTFGQPVLVFPTAGGDAEEIERFLLIKVLEPLLSAGRIKVYSCDSVAGRVWFGKEGSPEHRMWMMNQFHQYVKHEVVPAIRRDCGSSDIPIWSAGASIGAFHAAAMVCRFPDMFHRALAMSGTYDLMRFIEARDPTEAFFVSSPLHFLPTLSGQHLDVLRTRHIHITSGEGRYEDTSENWKLATPSGEWASPTTSSPGGRTSSRLGHLASDGPEISRRVDTLYGGRRWTTRARTRRSTGALRRANGASSRARCSPTSARSSGCSSEDRFERGVSRIGAEQEMFLVDRGCHPAPAALKLLEKVQDIHFTTELGIFQIEMNADPQPFAGRGLATDGGATVGTLLEQGANGLRHARRGTGARRHPADDLARRTSGSTTWSPTRAT